MPNDIYIYYSGGYWYAIRISDQTILAKETTKELCRQAAEARYSVI